MVAELEKTTFQQTEVGEIPSDWEVKILGELGKWKGGGTPSKARLAYWTGNIPWVSPKDMKGLLIKDTEDHITPKAINESSTTLLSPNSVLIVTRSGILRNYIPIATNTVPVAINQDIKALTVGEGFSSPFIFQTLIGFQNNIKEATVKSGTTVESVDFKAFKAFKIPLPPTLAEQTAIATALTDADALITQLSTLIAKKKAIKQGTMQELLMPKEGWEVKSLSEISIMKSGETITSKRISELDQYPCFGGNGLRGYTSNFTHNGNFALIGRQGALCGNVQFASGQFFASEHAVVVTPKSNTDIKWLYYILVDMNLNQYSESSAQPGLSVAKILNLDISVPPTKVEQTRIAQILSDMDAEIEKLEQRLEKQKQLKQGMMQVLLTGRIRLLTT